ncbi:MAG: hypothetical protein QOF91_3242, partial [Alphaproteobacteria bacterium]|nr:hypothetical protein [Alphaproteobacteria bacterium]
MPRGRARIDALNTIQEIEQEDGMTYSAIKYEVD